MKEAELHDLWSINESFARARDFSAVLDALATAVPSSFLALIWLFSICMTKKEKCFALGLV
ncbi:hypothetical protein [Bacillus sp. JCM 19041]|uniref:hypothetical protein n=1 Tax=Bacillus sp. JCM 19041 TaxID=1460637 RepID=UPI0006D0218B